MKKANVQIHTMVKVEQKTKKPPKKMAFNRARVGIRTPNLLIRSQMLYPIELRMPLSEIARVGNNLKRECKDSKNINMYN